MKRIVKSNSDIQSQIDSWAARAKRKSEYDWEHFSQDRNQDGIYVTTKTSLVNEQGGICCYCERRIAVDQSSHIEHFKGKSKYLPLVFVYNNLHTSCNGIPGTRDHCCGHKRAEHGNPDIPVSPLDDKCESRFRFTGRGVMKPASEDDNDAINTIDFLGLNSPKLRGMRERLMHQLEDCVRQMTDKEIAAFIDGKLQTDRDGRFPPFFTAIQCHEEALVRESTRSG